MIASGSRTSRTSHRQHHDPRNYGDSDDSMMMKGPTVSLKLNTSPSEMSSISASHSHFGDHDVNSRRGAPTAVVLSDEIISSRLAQGRCAVCGLQTHQLVKKSKGLGFRSKNKPVAMKMIPMTNPMVYQGRCLLCYPIDSIPPPTPGIPNIAAPRVTNSFFSKRGMVSSIPNNTTHMPPPPPAKVSPQLETKFSTDTMSTHTRSTRGTAATGHNSQDSHKSALSTTTVRAEDDGVEVHLDDNDNKENFGSSFDEPLFNSQWGHQINTTNVDETSLPKIFSRDSGDDNHSHDRFHQSFGGDNNDNMNSSSFKVQPFHNFQQSTPTRKKAGSNLAKGISPARTVSTISSIEEEGRDEELESPPTLNSSVSNTGNRSSKEQKQEKPINSRGGSVKSSKTNDSGTYTAVQNKNWWIPPTPASTAKASTRDAESKEKEDQNSNSVMKAVVAIRLAAPQAPQVKQADQKNNRKPQKPSEYIKTITKHMKAHKSSLQVQQAGCTQLFVLAADNVGLASQASSDQKDSVDGLPALYSAMLNYNVVPLVLNAMSRFPGAPEVQIPALGALYILVGKHSKFQEATRDSEGFEILARTHGAFSGEQGLQEHDDDDRNPHNGSPNEKFSPQHIEIQKMACIAWANLVVSSSKKNGVKSSLTTKDHQTLAAKCGAIPLILRSLEHSGHGRPNLKYNPGLSLFAGGALANLGAKHPANMDLIRQENGVRILEDVHSYFDIAEKERQGQDDESNREKEDPRSSYKPILQLLRAAIGNLEKDAIRFFATEEDLDEPLYSRETMLRVVDVMRVHSNSIDVVTEGCRLLWHMSASGSVTKNDISDNIDDVLREVGALDVLIETLERHMPVASVADVACGALWNLTSASEENQDHVREVDGINTLARVLSWYREPEHRSPNGDNPQDVDHALVENEVSAADVVGNCMCAVANVVARNVINQTCMRAVDAVPLIIDNMNEHVEMLDVQHFALGALANLSYNHYENSREIVDQGGIDTILHIMERYQNHAEIQASACGALSNICAAGGDDARVELQSMKSIRVLRDAATNFPKACGKYVDEIVSPTSFDMSTSF